ncbi:MAG: DUF732 domain-containing protein [Corynebacterium sp.]|uniref:DUF732 domain-containing protein n=1 Tax=Corynebacterium sp. TaxID=1720 RepID=UPI0026DD7FEF|nr:DUF732 domain-containing protein [Corynebacterium sp.]MDO5099793.1 DUF732 domain-containing protein [Corynebacterium sp.]
MKRLVVAMLAAVTSFGLVACGGSTATDSAGESSIAPLTRAAKPSTSGEATTTSSKTAAQPEQKKDLPADGAAEEVSEIPDPAIQLSDADNNYLDLLKEGGIKVDGVENQMIGAAEVVCGDQFPAAVHAVAGQLVEQNRTSLTVEEVIPLIENSARKSYC